MSADFPNNKRNSGKPGATSITTSQRSTCNAVFYRWANVDISKLNLLDATSESVTSGNRSSTGNLETRTRVIIRNDIIRCNITKTKASNAGQFSITLKKGKQVRGNKVLNRDINYLDAIHPGDWVMLYIKKSGEININSTSNDSGLKMMGIVRNVRYVEIEDEKTGMPRLEYIVTGDDFGAIFDTNIFFNPLINQETASTILGAKFLSDAQDSIKGSDRPDTASGLDAFTPDNVIKKLTSFYLGGNGGLDATNVTNQPWYIPRELASRFRGNLRNRGSVSFVDILNLDRVGLHKYVNGRFTKADTLPGATLFKSLPSTGSVWSVLQFAQNAIANEMYTELVRDSRGNLKPSLVCRQVPFSNRSNYETNAFFQARASGTPASEVPKNSDKTFITDLPRHNVVSSDIKSKNIGKSDFERINHLLVVPKLDIVENLDATYKSSINVASIQRYGLKTFQGQTGYILGNKIGNPTKTCKFFLDLMVDWFFLSHQLFNGTIVLDGLNEHLEIGNNLYVSDIGQLFHIEGYTHTYENAASGETDFQTSVSVSRGQFFKNNRAKFIGPSALQDEPTTITSSSLEGLVRK